MENQLIFMLLCIFLLTKITSCCNPGCLDCDEALKECRICEPHYYYSFSRKDCIETCIVSISHSNTHGGFAECLDDHEEVFSVTKTNIYVSVFIIVGILGFCGIISCVAAIKNRQRSKIFNQTKGTTYKTGHETITEIPTDACCQDLEGGAMPTNIYYLKQCENRMTRSSSSSSETENL